jgi:hypothetical protein
MNKGVIMLIGVAIVLAILTIGFGIALSFGAPDEYIALSVLSFGLSMLSSFLACGLYLISRR